MVIREQQGDSNGAFTVDSKRIAALRETGTHIGEDEIPYIFTTPKALLEDFRNDVDNWRF